MYFTRAALCAVLLLGGVIGVAQTVVRIAPPPPVRVGVIGVAPHPGYVWIGGFVRHVRVSFGCLPVGSEAEAAGYFIRDPGASNNQKNPRPLPGVSILARLATTSDPFAE